MVEAPCRLTSRSSLVGEMRAVFRLALGEGLLLAVVGVGKMIDAGEQRAVHPAVIDDAADRSAAEADAVIAALAADQAGAGALAAESGDRRARSSARYRRPPSRNCRRTRGRGPSGARSAMRLASSKAWGMPNWNGGA